MSCCGSGSLSVGPGEEGEGTSQRVGASTTFLAPSPVSTSILLKQSPLKAPGTLEKQQGPVRKAKKL